MNRKFVDKENYLDHYVLECVAELHSRELPDLQQWCGKSMKLQCCGLCTSALLEKVDNVNVKFMWAVTLCLLLSPAR